MRRRDFFTTIGGSAAGLAITASCRRPPGVEQQSHRVLVVAFDGLDPVIAKSLMDAGKMPNLARLSSQGSFAKIKTSTPPHTPVAFSDIISGADASVHQIYDFIHRDPRPETGAVRPYFSTADIVAPELSWLPSSIPLGGQWQAPLTGGKTVLLRRGASFWDFLIREGVDTQVYFLPSNYPPPKPAGPGKFRCLSGMGTPDLLGGYGEFTLLTPDAPRDGRIVDGGRFVRLRTRNHRASAELEGPTDFMRKTTAAQPLTTKIEVVRDPTADVAKIQVSEQLLLLKEGEWSNWIPIKYRSKIPAGTALGIMGAPTSIQGMARVFLKSVHPKMEIYISPINIDPTAPVARISTPQNLAQSFAKKFGRFHTNGIPEDTKALTHNALSADQFLDQSHAVVAERVKQYKDALKSFSAGCLFFYFGATDLLQHMFWRDQDDQHPGRIIKESERYEKVVEDTYMSIDEQIGDGLAALGPNDTMIVLSDHGFTSFRRGFNLNSWLVEKGFIRLNNPSKQGQSILFTDVNWEKTKAYGLGLNGLYVNQQGRELHGSVSTSAKKSVVNELRDKLQEVQDEDGSMVIDSVAMVDEIFPGADADVAPDLIVGYADNFRASWETVLGGMPRDLLQNNMDRWSGTHLTAPDIVPGLVASNREINVQAPSISDIAPTILAEFGIKPPQSMTGKVLFANQ